MWMCCLYIRTFRTCQLNSSKFKRQRSQIYKVAADFVKADNYAEQIEVANIMSPTDGRATEWFKHCLTSESTLDLEIQLQICRHVFCGSQNEISKFRLIDSSLNTCSAEKVLAGKTMHCDAVNISQIFESKYCLFLQKLINSLT